MKSPPGSISPPEGCREHLQNPHELGFDMAAASGQVSWKIMVTLMFLEELGIYRRQGQPRGGTKRRGGVGPGPRPQACGAPLVLPFGLCVRLAV